MIILILETLGEMLKSTKRQIIRINNKMHEIVYNNINIDCTILGKKYKHAISYHSMHNSLHKEIHKDTRKQKNKRKETH